MHFIYGRMHWPRSHLAPLDQSHPLPPAPRREKLPCLPSHATLRLPGTVSERISEHAQNARLFSVVQLGGKQYKITTDDVITIDKIDADVGERIVLEKVESRLSPRRLLVAVEPPCSNSSRCRASGLPCCRFSWSGAVASRASGRHYWSELGELIAGGKEIVLVAARVFCR